MSEIDDYWQAKIEPLEEELKQARWFAKNIVAAMAPVLLDAGLGVDAKPSEVIAQVEKLRMDYGKLKAEVEAAQRFANARPDLVDALAENARLRAVVDDIVGHANPIAEDDDGFVAIGYTVSIGAIHRAMAALQGAKPDVSGEAT